MPLRIIKTILKVSFLIVRFKCLTKRILINFTGKDSSKTQEETSFWEIKDCAFSARETVMEMVWQRI